MAKKTKTVFVCQECGYESPKWMGQCICGAWGTMVEEKVDLEPEKDMRSRSSAVRNGRKVKPSVLKKVGSADYERISTGIGELDRVLGGGLVKGSLVLISGEPGIGKSTLIVQAASHIAKAGKTVLYVSGEESEEQIKMRADRVCPDLMDDLPTFGLMFEALAVRDLRTYAELIDGKLYHYLDKSGLECDIVIHLRNGCYGLVEVKLGGDRLIEKGASSLLSVAGKIDVTRMKKPSFLMVLVADGDFAYRRKDDGVIVCPIGCLKP